MHSERLPNGLEILVLPSPAAPVVALQAWIGVGSLYERPAEAGAAHFLEHMLFKGTAKRGPGELAREVEAVGGDINAWTEFNNTAYHLVLARRYFALGLDVLADAVQRPKLDPEEIERERQVILEELQQGEDSPHRTNFQQLFSKAFGRHPYGRPVIGRRETVAAMGRPELREFHRRWYAPNNLTFIVAGDVTADEVVPAIRRAFRGKARELPPRPRRASPRPRAPRATVTRAPVNDAYLLLGFHVPGLTHADTPAIDLAATLLGQGDSSRLHQRVLRERQLVNDVSAYAFSPHDAGLFTVGASLSPERLEPAVQGLLEEVFALGTDAVGREEIDKARLLSEASAVMQGETAQGLARKAGHYHATAGDAGYETSYLEAMRAVTPGSLRRALGRYLQPPRCTLALVLPQAEAEAGDSKGLSAWRTQLERQCEQAFERATARRPPAAPAPGRGGIVRTELENGLRLLVRPEPSVPLVAMRAVWQGGLRYERPQSNGINNLIASLLTRGTPTRSGDEIVAAVEGMAGSIGGFTGRNSLGMRLETLARHFRDSLEILADCLQHPRFDAQEFERERALTLQEIATRDDNLTGAAFRLFQQRLFARHPYRLSLAGEADSVGRLTPCSLQRYFKKHYRPGGLVLSVVGDVDPDEVVSEAHRLLGRGPAHRDAAPKVPGEPERAGPQQAERVLDKQQAHLLLGFPGVAVSQADRFTLEVLAAVLSGQGGRLFVNIRDQLGLVYRISAFSLEGLDPGYFAVYAATSPNQVDRLVREVRAELRRLRRDPVSGAELRRARRFLIGHHDLSLQQRATLSTTMAFNELYGLGYAAHLSYPDHIQAVTAKDLTRAARRYLRPSRETLAVVRPESPAA